MRPAMTADLTHCGSLLDALPDPALLVGPDRRILLANPAARELFSAPLVGSSALSSIRQPEPGGGPVWIPMSNLSSACSDIAAWRFFLPAI